MPTYPAGPPPNVWACYCHSTSDLICISLNIGNIRSETNTQYWSRFSAWRVCGSQGSIETAARSHSSSCDNPGTKSVIIHCFSYRQTLGSCVGHSPEEYIWFFDTSDACMRWHSATFSASGWNAWASTKPMKSCIMDLSPAHTIISYLCSFYHFVVFVLNLWTW